ncbi:hypothetical protein G6F56_008374 [Rhizopus delemar]|nr:hypothetical protein G6F56_008374 [Rhizopus delemar]
MRLFIIASTALSAIGVAQAASQYHPCQETYKAVDGDTCASISSAHGISKDNLSQWTNKINSKFDCDNIKAGDVFCVESSISKRDVHEPKKSASPPPPKGTAPPPKDQDHKADKRDVREPKKSASPPPPKGTAPPPKNN